jgi:WD40 repeat protein
MAWHPDGVHLAIGYFMQDEVEVWNVQTKQPVLNVPSHRRIANMSGQEVTFSPDGKYLIVQDFVDSKNGEPRIPRTYDDPNELPAQADKQRYILARVWDWEQRKEVEPLRGPASKRYGTAQGGFCWVSGQKNVLAMHRSTAVVTYDVTTGSMLDETDVHFPFTDRPDMNISYWKMACNPTQPFVALEGQQFPRRDGPMFGYPAGSGVTPIVVADLEKKRVYKVLISPTPLNGVTFTADGGKLLSFGAPPIRVWDATRDYALVGEIWDPKENTNYFAGLNGFDGVLGLSGDLHLWNAQQLKRIATEIVPPNVFRITVHQPSKTVAVAIGRFAHLYRFNPAAINAPSIGK